MHRLSEQEILDGLSALTEWEREGDAIERTFELHDFAAAMGLVNQVAVLAEARMHHPDIQIRWNRVTLALTTHDAGGLTVKDLELAGRIDEVARAGTPDEEQGA